MAKFDPDIFQTGRLKNYKCDGQLSIEDLDIDVTPPDIEDKEIEDEMEQ